MTNEVYQRVFTLDEANAALPLVRAIVADWVRLSQEVVDRRQRVAMLNSGRAGSRDVYSEELAQIEEELEKDNDKLREYIAELTELGVEPKDPLAGLVDFPALKDGRPVYLCWKLGEPCVEFWHELDGGFRGRQPVTDETANLQN